MKIISVSRGFTADHSSTSYEFVAVDKPLNAEQRKEVRSLSRRCRPGARRVNFIYHADGYDIPGGWVRLLKSYYDVMYSESYDWWTLAMAFPVTAEEAEALEEYEFSDADGLGIHVYAGEKRAVVVINCRLSIGLLFDCDDQGYCYGGIEEDDEEEGVEAAEADTEDHLLNMLIKLRRRLMDGDYRVLYEVWKVYGKNKCDDRGEEVICPPKPPHQEKGKSLVAEFVSLLETL